MQAEGFHFEIEDREGDARRGQLTTPHGVVETPAFMSVATFGAVRGVAADDLRGLGAQILLANTYHLHERPGESLVRDQGGLHGFTGWDGPWLTDSGGFQVTSLADRVKLEEQGVTFSSPLDGKRRLLTPEKVIEIQEALGPDIAMVLDECHPPIADAGRGHEVAPGALEKRMADAVDRTLRWAQRSVEARRRRDQAVFGIIQGGVYSELRQHSAQATAKLSLDGFAHGGLGLGESLEERGTVIRLSHAELPEQAPRYLMGLGKPLDIVEAVACGVDLFDCVIPTRNGRHGLLFTRRGVLTVRNARFKNDPEPPEPGCSCPTCSRYSRAYLRHLLHTGEALGSRLATLHNLHFYLTLMRDCREHIKAGTYETFRAAIEAISEQRAD